MATNSFHRQYTSVVARPALRTRRRRVSVSNVSYMFRFVLSILSHGMPAVGCTSEGSVISSIGGAAADRAAGELGEAFWRHPRLVNAVGQALI